MRAFGLLFSCFVMALNSGAQVLLATPRIPAIRIMAHGDSITLGVDASTNYLTRVSEMATPLYTSPWVVDYVNAGINAVGFNYGASNLVLTGTNLIDARVLSNRPDYLIVFAGTNDIWLGGYTPDQTYAYFTNYFNARVTAGWLPTSVYVCTMLPREARSEVTRSDFNNLLVSGASTLGYSLVRLDLDPSVGCAGCQSNLTYYAANQIHPNTLGQMVIATNVFDALFP